MKRLLLLTLLLANVAAMAQSKFAGTWQGALSISGISLRVVLHITDDGMGHMNGTMDSPDQGVKGIPCSNIQVLGDSIIVDIAKSAAQYRAKMTEGTTISGVFIQKGRSLPLELKKSDAPVAELNRPQTPKPPFPYNSDDVVYENADKSIKYGATITSPKDGDKHPALLLITGSGQQNRDEEIAGHKPFAVIADYLTRRGYIVMRVDDRGVGQSTGDVRNATSADFAKDVEVSLDYLKKYKNVDKKKLGLCGHSEGGMIAEMVAAERKDVDFIILMAAPGEKTTELMTEQNVDIFKTMGIAPEAADDYGNLFRQIAEASAASKDEASFRKTVNNDVTEWRAKTPKNVVFATTHIMNDSFQKVFVDQIVEGIYSPWFHYFLSYDPAPVVEKISCKVLALDGSKDIQVKAKTNLAGLKEALGKSKSKDYTTKEVDGVNHLFQKCNNCTLAEYSQLEQTINPDVLTIMGDWLDKHVK